MESSQASEELIGCVDGCIRELQDLINAAGRPSATHRTSSRTNLLNNVRRSAKDCSRSLQSWKKDLSQGFITDDKQVVDTTVTIFENLQDWISRACEFLISRLYWRRAFLIGYISSKRIVHEKGLNRALNSVEKYMGKLNGQMKLLLIDPSQSEDRQNILSGVNRNRVLPYNDFSHFFRNLNPEAKKRIRSLALEKFWGHLTQSRDPLPELEGKVGNQEDCGDGILYKAEHIKWANQLLHDLHQAWTNMDDSTLHPPPPNLVSMGKICLILIGMRRPQLFLDFLDHNICDSDLHLDRSRLEDVLKEENRKFVGTFLAEQYRVEQRNWHDGDHVEMEDEEPLPWTWDKPYREGSYGNVTRVRDSTGRYYALKQQNIGSVASVHQSAREHLQHERDRLRGLEHKHIVRVVKSYERANKFGLLIEPAATTDLGRLLDRFRNNKYCATEACNDQEWLKPVLMKAFGCLSHSLAYIHTKSIRHKDIKPDNILYERAMKQNQGARFLWADFGLAYDFSSTGNSKTHGTKLYSKRYAAPEIFKASVNHERKSGVMSLDRIVESSNASEALEAHRPEAKIMSVHVEDEETSHGRTTDIFSLGCVFLEILAVLVSELLPVDHDQKSSLRRHNANEVRLPNGDRVAAAPVTTDGDVFGKNIPQLKSWAQIQSQRCHQSTDQDLARLAPLFDLAVSMISSKPRERPLINGVIRSFASHGEEYFCKNCWAELPPESKVDTLKGKAAKLRPKLRRSGTANAKRPGSPSNNGEATKSLFRRSTAALHSD